MLQEGSSSQVGRGVLQNCMHFRRRGLTEIDFPTWSFSPSPVSLAMLLYHFVLGCLSLQMGLFQPALDFVDLVLHQIQLCTSLHSPVGMLFLLVGHQFPLDRFAGPSDLALVVDDGPTQLTRISLSRVICPGLDQEVATSLRWYLVVDSLGLLLQ